MDTSQKSQLIIEKYKEDENVMIRLFAQWCANHSIDSEMLYAKAYPTQPANSALQEAIANEETIEDLPIDTETMLDILQLFGNDDLAFAIAEEVEKNPLKY